MITIKDKKATNDQLFEMAVAAGCKPEWFDGIFGWRWHCGCEDMAHFCDSQCSMITVDSLLHPNPQSRGPHVPSPEEEARRCAHGYISWENSCEVCREVKLGLKPWRFRDQTAAD